MIEYNNVKVYGDYLPIAGAIQIMVSEKVFKCVKGNDFKKVLKIVNRDLEEMNSNKF